VLRNAKSRRRARKTERERERRVRCVDGKVHLSPHRNAASSLNATKYTGNDGVIVGSSQITQQREAARTGRSRLRMTYRRQESASSQ